MDIRQAKQEIKNTLRAYHRRDENGGWAFPLLRQRPVLLMGPPGIGKTAIMAQIAREEGVGLVSYTMTHHTRQSAVGLPRIGERQYEGMPPMTVTEYTLSEIIASVYDHMEQTGRREGILFIDEINCVSETLVPTMLQFLQNKTFGNHPVPEGWMIVAAGNPPEYNRSVREFDVVTLDRLRRIDIEARVDVWLEYARDQQVHGAILSWLEICPEDFYRVELDEEETRFVTARGWEDLSQLMRSYEDMGVAVTEDVIRQYLQHDGTARRFAAYYRLYRKYGADYAIPAILAGEEPAWREKAAMAAAGGMEERFAVVNLWLDALGHDFAQYEMEDRRAVALHELLGDMRAYLHRGTVDEFLRQRRAALEIKAEKGTLSREQACTEDALLRRAEAYNLTLTAERVPGEAAFERISALYEKDLANRQRLVTTLSARLDRAFAFLHGAFGEGAEMTLFLTGLTHSKKAMDYITRHGSEAFLSRCGSLLYREREEDLQRECFALLREEEGVT